MKKEAGVGITTVLTIVFVVLKLLEIIDWSWWWVLLPTYGPILLVAVIIFLWWIIETAIIKFTK